MKLMHEQVDFPGRSTIRIYLRDTPHFTYPWHFHSQYEFIYVLESYGTRFVADNIDNFRPGDLVLLGTNLPHFWKSDEAFHQGDPDLKVKAVILQFHAELFREEFDKYADFQTIKELLVQSSRGIHFLPPTSEKAGRMILEILKTTGFMQVIRFLELMYLLSKSKDFRLLATEAYRVDFNHPTNDRLARVMFFVNQNYRQKISLEKVAEIAGYQNTAFCRFFREKTGKSFTDFLNEMRIGYACKLLIEGNYTVSQICYECGFNNLSNFNRTFKRITSFSPKDYQKKYEYS